MTSTFIAGPALEVKAPKDKVRKVLAAHRQAQPLSSRQLNVRNPNQNGSGDPGKTRTSGTQFRKLLLYPPELRGHVLNHHVNHLLSTTYYYQKEQIASRVKCLPSL